MDEDDRVDGQLTGGAALMEDAGGAAPTRDEPTGDEPTGETPEDGPAGEEIPEDGEPIVAGEQPTEQPTGEAGEPAESADGADGADGAESPAGVRPEVLSTLEQSAASWVPPWARAVPELVIEPASDDPEEPPLLPPRLMDAVREDALREGEPGEGPVEEEPAEPVGSLAEEELRGALEAILLVVDEPVSEQMLAQVLEEPTVRVAETMLGLAQDYVEGGRGFELRRAAGGWRLYTRGEFAVYVERFVLDGQQVRLTQAALETLAVVAYKQPVTRSRVAAIRGVNCDGVIKTLVGRGLVEECGTETESGAHLYRTTTLFLEKLGIDEVAQLPPLAPFLPNNVDEIDRALRR